MKIYDIMLFILMFNLSLSLLTNIGFAPAGNISPIAVNGQSTYAWSNSLTSQTQNITSQVTAQGTSLIAVFSWLNTFYLSAVLVLSVIFNTLFYATVGFPLMLNNIGVPLELNIVLTTGVIIVFAFGLFQIFGKSTFRDYE